MSVDVTNGDRNAKTDRQGSDFPRVHGDLVWPGRRMVLGRRGMAGSLGTADEALASIIAQMF